MNSVLNILKQEGLVVHPSDTVYGLLCDATNPEAVKKLLEFKERPAGKAVSIFVSDIEMAKDYVVIDKKTERRLNEILPGPYTIVLKSKHKVVKALESEKGTLGIRIPNYPAILELVKKFGKPLTATSANLSSLPPHYSIDSYSKQVAQGRNNLVDLIVDGGKLPYNKPSTVVDFTTNELKTLRLGDAKISNFKFQISKSERETREIAKEMLKKAVSETQNKPIVFILKGDLGAGKTVFAKGLGEALGIERIVSPTFVVYYEYPLKKIYYFVHVDLYNISDKEEFKHLGLEKYFKPGNIMCIEWGEKAGEIVKGLEEIARLIYVNIEHVKETERKISINF